MGLAAQLLGRVRGATNPTSTFNDTTDQAVRCNGRGEGLFVQALPQKAEVSRLGASWQASIPTGSAFTTVAAWPTTRAELVVSNTAPAGRIGATCMIIDYVWQAQIVTETAASAQTLIAQVSTAGRIATATNNTAVLVTSMSGKAAAYAGVGTFALANTAFAIASQWQVLPNQPNALSPAAVGVGSSSTADCHGLLIVPPQATLCLNLVVGTAVASAGIIGLVWHEQVLDLGA
jgi:hypothetical protein